MAAATSSFALDAVGLVAGDVVAGRQRGFTQPGADVELSEPIAAQHGPCPVSSPARSGGERLRHEQPRQGRWMTVTGTARTAIQLARREAARAGRRLAGPEHLLLGLLALPGGEAAAMLGRAGIELEAARRLLGAGAGSLPGHAEISVRARTVLEHALDEAVRLQLAPARGAGVTVRPAPYLLSVKVLGIDPGTASCGYGVIQRDGSRLRALDHGVWRTRAGDPPAARLRTIFDGVAGLIALHAPAAVALEESFVGADARIALSVGQARGAVLVASAGHDIPCTEYPPASVKQAVCGYGRAEKVQVQRMVQTILGLERPPRPDHAADALAVAICHALAPPLLRAVAG